MLTLTKWSVSCVSLAYVPAVERLKSCDGDAIKLSPAAGDTLGEEALLADAAAAASAVAGCSWAVGSVSRISRVS